MMPLSHSARKYLVVNWFSYHDNNDNNDDGKRNKNTVMIIITYKCTFTYYTRVYAERDIARSTAEKSFFFSHVDVCIYSLRLFFFLLSC